MKIIIKESQYKILVEQYTEDELKINYVDSGLVPENQFIEIMTNFEKPFYRNWLLKMLSKNFIDYKNINNYNNFFKIFEKYKKYYPIKDLGQIKTKDDVIDFERKTEEIILKQKDVEQRNSVDKKNLVNVRDIEKLDSVGIKYLGMVDGYQSFKIPPEIKDNVNAWRFYRDILGNCSNRSGGEIVSLCTTQSFEHFRTLLSLKGNSNLFLFYNQSDPLSPYQIQLKTKQFMDKNDKKMDLELQKKFSEFLSKNNERNSDFIEPTNEKIKELLQIEINKIYKHKYDSTNKILLIQNAYINTEDPKVIGEYNFKTHKFVINGNFFDTLLHNVFSNNSLDVTTGLIPNETLETLKTMIVEFVSKKSDLEISGVSMSYNLKQFKDLVTPNKKNKIIQILSKRYNPENIIYEEGRVDKYYSKIDSKMVFTYWDFSQEIEILENDFMKKLEEKFDIPKILLLNIIRDWFTKTFNKPEKSRAWYL